MKHFALIELENDDAPSIGVITDIPNTEYGQELFKGKFLDAVGSHFDAADFNHSEIGSIEDLFSEAYVDIDVEIDGFNYTVRVMETWIY